MAQHISYIFKNSSANLCWALGGIICNFTPILRYFRHWGVWTSTTISSGEQIKFHVSKFRWRPKKSRSSPKTEHFFPKTRRRPKKKVFTKNGTLFFPRFQVKTCTWMHTGIKLLEGMQMKTLLKLFWGRDAAKLLGGYIPHPPQGFGTPV